MPERARKLVEVPASSRTKQDYDVDQTFPNHDVAERGLNIYHRYVTHDGDPAHKILFTHNRDGDGRSWAHPGNKNFKDDEIAKPDKFHDPYVGKTYQDLSGKTYATEVTPMGIERLHADPLEFAKNDPDYFDHTIKVLRGQYL